MTPKIKGYGYGWMTGKFQGKKYIRHSGGYPGYMSEFIYYPDEDLTIIILNNFGNYEQSVWAIGMGLACIVFNKPYDHWKARKEVRLPEGVLSRYTGSYSLDKKRSIAITSKDGDLVVEIGGLPPMKLFAESDNRFYLENFNTEYKFIIGENGFATQLTIHEHGADYILKKKQ